MRRFLGRDDTLSTIPSLFDKLVKMGDQMREDKSRPSVLIARSWGQKHRRNGNTTRFTDGLSANCVSFNKFSVTVSGLSGNCTPVSSPR